MRLEFNVAVIDDDFEDEKKSRAVNTLVAELRKWIVQKGFEPVFFRATNMNQCLKDECLDGEKHYNRIDLYLSDNNLGGVNQDGIDLYLKLKESKLICDFILYTRSDIKEIIEKISNDLHAKQNPNLFSRFTFVSRSDDPADDNWHKPIREVLDHIISTREEINHLRGLFAQVTARIHLKMQELVNDKRIDFKEAIRQCHTDDIIDRKLKQRLTKQRLIRNDIIHNNEYYDQSTGTFIIKGKGKNLNKTYCRNNFPQLRKDLLSVKDEFFEQIKKS